MNIIVVADNKWGIGKNNGLLFRLPADMKFFREKTVGKVVIMGANTFASLPHGALPDRVNIVLDDSGKKYNGAITATDIPQLLRLAAQYSTDDVFVCGGASVYAQLLNKCAYAYVTKAEADGNADAFFPDLDALPNWRQVSCSDPVCDGGITIRFCTYRNTDIA